ncbi:hypothetical protein L0F63_000927 [Massospora cicadina]|nr:hypothetical protein L0F63_000927 [Massospora cicadina]
MLNSDEDFEVVEMAQSQIQTEAQQKVPRSKPVRDLDLAATFGGRENATSLLAIDNNAFSAPELGHSFTLGPVNDNDVAPLKGAGGIDRAKPSSKDDTRGGPSGAIEGQPVESLEPHKADNSTFLGTSSFVDASGFPPSSSGLEGPSRGLNGNFDLCETQDWDELTESEVGYRRRQPKEVGSHFRDFAISHLNKPVADPANAITLVIIGDMVNQDDAATVGGTLARSVNRTEITGSSTKLGDRPPLRLFNLTQISFSAVLSHLAAMQAERDRGLMRPKLECLKRIGESVNLLPLLTQPAESSTRVEPICKKLLAERLVEAGVRYYTLSPTTGRLGVGASGSLETAPEPCATVQEFANCPVFQLIMAWPAIRKSAQDKQASHPVAHPDPSSATVRWFVAVISAVLAVGIYCLRFSIPADVNAEFRYAGVLTRPPVHPPGGPAQPPTAPSDAEPLHADDMAFQADFKPSL